MVFQSSCASFIGKIQTPPWQSHPFPPTLGSASSDLCSSSCPASSSRPPVSPLAAWTALILLSPEKRFLHPWLCVCSWHMLMFGKSAWNRAGSLPNMSPEATNKLLCSKGFICCKLKLNKGNNPLLFWTPWKLWASSPLGQNLCCSWGWDHRKKCLVPCAQHHVPSTVQGHSYTYFTWEKVAYQG